MPFPIAWLLAGLVLLKAALPMLAAAAAESRALPLGEICTLYGVRTVAVVHEAAAPATPDRPDDPEHLLGASDACALGWLFSTEGGAADGPRSLPPAERSRELSVATLPATPLPDAVRTWRALLKQGPPRG